MPADVTASTLFQDLKLGFSIFYCQNVAQFDGLLAKVRNTSDYVLVNASLIYSLFLVKVAVNKALLDVEIKTKTLNTEVIYNLSHTTSISQSLTQYGFNDGCANYLLILWKSAAAFPSEIECEFGNLEQFNANRNLNAIYDNFGVESLVRSKEILIEKVICNSMLTKNV